MTEWIFRDLTQRSQVDLEPENSRDTSNGSGSFFEIRRGSRLTPGTGAAMDSARSCHSSSVNDLPLPAGRLAQLVRALP